MAVTTPRQQALLSRVRELIPDESDIRQVSMFGGRAIMVDEKMIVSIGKDGSLLVRVDPGDHEPLLTEPGAEQAEMGAGRTMGPGWITVRPDMVEDDRHLTLWVDAALTYNRTLTTARP